MIKVKTRNLENNIDTLQDEVNQIKRTIDQLEVTNSKMTAKSKDRLIIQNRLDELYTELDDKEYKIQQLEEEEEYIIQDYADKIYNLTGITEFKVTLSIKLNDDFLTLSAHEQLREIADEINYGENDYAEIKKISKVKNKSKAQQIKDIKKEFVQECKDKGFNKAKIASMWQMAQK